MTVSGIPSTVGVWLLATRPKTLPAALAPVIVGTALAYADGRFVLLPALAALVGALLLQIGVNLANDYFDYIKGVDTEDRLGPMRVTQSGLIKPQTVKTGMIMILLTAALIGLYLFQVAGWPVLAIGAAAILSALGYSGGKHPLASRGLGDLFVFLFFGLVAVCGTYYVQALQMRILVIFSAVPVGFLITAIIVVNNLRDIRTDQVAGKYTLAVRLGERGTRLEYTLLVLGAYLFPTMLWIGSAGSAWLLLPLISLPAACLLISKIRISSGAELNALLAQTALLSVSFCFLFALGLIL